MKSSALALMAVGLSVAGCATLDAGGAAGERQSAIDLSDYFAENLEIGRLNLRSGRPTQAIEAFRQASRDPAHAVSALNGMAVAYIRLGREDVAEKLFLKAHALDPSDMRASRNLARLDARATQVPAIPSPARPGLAQAAEYPPTAGEPQLAIEAPRLVVSTNPEALRAPRRSAIALRTADNAPRPSATIRAKSRPRTRSPLVAKASAPVRIEPRSASGPSRVIRVAIPETVPAPKPAKERRFVRVALATKK